MNNSSLVETADFAGAMSGEAFVRNTQIRCTMSNLQVSPENPETYGGDASEDSVPDVIAKYVL